MLCRLILRIRSVICAFSL